MRIGIGYDIHRLEEGRRLVLGGVTVPFEKGLAGHSDGDAVAHAVIDAILGAAALGNIGQHFPDTAPQYKDADSMALLVRVMRLIRERGSRPVNIDVNIVAEQPRLGPHVDMMRQRLAECMGLHPSEVSIKPKTNEGCGPEGRGEAISAQAVVLLEDAKAS